MQNITVYSVLGHIRHDFRFLFSFSTRRALKNGALQKTFML